MNDNPLSPQEYHRQINACQLAGLDGLARVLLAWYAEDYPNELHPSAQLERQREKDSHNPFPALSPRTP